MYYFKIGFFFIKIYFYFFIFLFKFYVVLIYNLRKEVKIFITEKKFYLFKQLTIKYYFYQYYYEFIYIIGGSNYIFC